ncbi:ribonuclease-like 3 [Alosa pseudoharengus]|uniref:ribonuclease-like 3 n=1 Tax=Alosa pseudoharengus TaxID=34774 RepID=UPI003F894A19
MMKTFLMLCVLSVLVFLFYTTHSVKGNPSSEPALSKPKHPKNPSPPQPSPETLTHYKKFINQHVDSKMAPNKCDREINGRHIAKTGGNKCKDANTFILEATNYIIAVCNKAGTPYQGRANLRISNQPFRVVNCVSKREGKHLPRCIYDGKSATKRIVLGCKEGYPVHYETGV